VAVTIDVRSGYPWIPIEAPSVNYGAITIDCRSVSPQMTKHIAVVIDCSPSMGCFLDGAGHATKIDLVTESLMRLIKWLHDGDVLTIVTFSDHVRVVVPAQSVGAHRSDIARAVATVGINTSVYSGERMMGGGIRAALSELHTIGTQTGINLIITLTDGPASDETFCSQVAKQTDIRLMLGGIGDDYNGALFNEMARSSRGIAEYIDRAELMQDFFGEIMAMAERTAITNAVLNLEFRQGFYPLRILQVDPNLTSFNFTPLTTTNRRATIPLGDIQIDGATLLIKYAYQGVGSATAFQVAGLDLTYDIPPHTQIAMHSDDFTVGLSNQSSFPPLDPVVKACIDRARNP